MMEEALKRGMAVWRQEHPQATLREIEAELDRQVAIVRAALLEETIAASAAAAGSWGELCGVWGADGGGREAEAAADDAGWAND